MYDLILFDSKNDLPRLDNISIKQDKSLLDVISQSEIKFSNDSWHKVNGPSSKGWTNNQLAYLYNTTNELVFGTSSYALYCSLFEENSPIRNSLHNYFHVGVGCAILTSDDYYIVQQRADGLIGGNFLDASAAGLIVIKNGNINFEEQMMEKISRELNVDKVYDLKFTGISGSRDFNCGHFTYSGRVDKTFTEMLSIINKKYVNNIIPVKKSDLKDFLLEEYNPLCPNSSMITDGFAVFLRTFPKNIQDNISNDLNDIGVKIKLGMIKSGELILN